jgi:hypothetical protein
MLLLRVRTTLLSATYDEFAGKDEVEAILRLPRSVGGRRVRGVHYGKTVRKMVMTGGVKKVGLQRGCGGVH